MYYITSIYQASWKLHHNDGIIRLDHNLQLQQGLHSVGIFGHIYTFFSTRYYKVEFFDGYYHELTSNQIA